MHIERLEYFDLKIKKKYNLFLILKYSFVISSVYYDLINMTNSCTAEE